MNKKIDQKQKSEIVSAELKEKDQIEVVVEDKQKDEPKNWKELNERNFTLEEILSLETNNEVNINVFFYNSKNNCKFTLKFLNERPKFSSIDHSPSSKKSPTG